MKITIDVEGTKARVEKLIHEVEHAADAVAFIVQEDSNKTERDFQTAGNTTTRSDESVHVIKSGNVVIERAVGSEVLFKEFGTGMSYAEHPLGASKGAVRGGYGKGRGKQSSGWIFSDEPGMAGEYATEIAGNDEMSFYRTKGQPASMPMYNSFRRLVDYIPKEIRSRLR